MKVRRVNTLRGNSGDLWVGRNVRVFPFSSTVLFKLSTMYNVYKKWNSHKTLIVKGKTTSLHWINLTGTT